MSNIKKYVIILVPAVLLIISSFFVFPKIFKSKKISIIQSQSKTTDVIEKKEASEKEEVDWEEVVTGENIIKSDQPADNLDSENKNTESKENTKEKNVAKQKSSLSITNKLVDWGFEKANGRKIDTIIIHSSYDLLGDDPYSVGGLINEYKQYGVAPHYLIDRKGNIYKLVEEKNIAYHAGESQTPDGRTNVNRFSIGIELMNKEDSKFTEEQYQALNELLKNIKSRYVIKYVLGHNQIAPGRKTDPWGLEWGKINK